jgi:carbon-monoxide dehydrogenase large subunit
VRFTSLPITPQKMLLALREKGRQGVETFRYPDDMPNFGGPRTHAQWPKPNVVDVVDFDWDNFYEEENGGDSL